MARVRVRATVTAKATVGGWRDGYPVDCRMMWQNDGFPNSLRQYCGSFNLHVLATAVS